MDSSRIVALRVLERILLDDAYSHIALDAELQKTSLDPRDRGLATQLVYGTLTLLAPIDAILDRALRRGLRGTEDGIVMLLRVATYELLFLDRIPARATIHSAVELARSQDHSATGMVNGVLRHIDRERDSLTWWLDRDTERKPVRYLSQRYGVPGFFANRLFQKHGLAWTERELHAITYEQAPLWGRCRTPRAMEVASEQEWKSSPFLTSAVELPGMTSEVRELLDSGELAIQDVGSQLVGKMCGHELADARVLDACAGLGGKSLHLLDAGAGHVTSVEPHVEKLAMLTALADPSRHTAFEGTIEDFLETSPEAFDLVLVDAPCTGLGVMRRHPEGRIRKKESDITQLAALQSEILANAATLVRPGGVLLYAVCTFTREEGSKQVERFLESHPEFTLEAPPAHPDVPDWSTVLDDEDYLRTWPSVHRADAFFAARMRRKNESNEEVM